MLAIAFVALPAQPAAAQELPAEPVLLHLKDYEEFKLAWNEEEGVHLSAEPAAWRFEPVREEALHDLGAHHLVLEGTGECLDAGALAPDGVHAPLDVVDCAEAEPWTVVYDDLPSRVDYRLATPEGYLLGLGHEESREEHSAVPTDGAEVFALDVEDSLHSHEWRLAVADAPPTSPPPTPPGSESPSERPSESSSEASPQAPSESASPMPALPVTGTALGLGAGAGVVAVAGGAALVLWWQRRRALRTDW